MGNNPWNDPPPWTLADTIEMAGYAISLLINLVTAFIGALAAVVGMLEVGCTLALMAPFVLLIVVVCNVLFGGR